MSDTFRSIFSRSSSQPQGGGRQDDSAAPVQPEGSREVRPDVIPGAVIRVIGAGGGGGNAVSRMITEKVHGVDFITVNTDAQALYHNPAGKKITIGRGTTRGLGAGANPDIGKKAAEESLEEIKAALEGTDMLFITAGLGGGTGSGTVPVIADAARSMGILTVAVVTRPFSFEGFKRRKQSEEALENLRSKVDTLITIPNDKILSLIDKTTPLTEAFQVVDEVLKHAIEGISSLITVHGLINVDFADVKAIMQDAGTALMGIGYGTGDSRAAEAARAAVDSPLLETSISGAQGILFNITGGNDLSMYEVDEAARIITEAAAPEANVIFGAVIDDAYTGQVKVTVVATGFVEEKKQMPQMVTPGQRVLQSNFGRTSAPAAASAPRQEGMRSTTMGQEQGPTMVKPTAGLELNMEELEVPAFMRKPLSK